MTTSSTPVDAAIHDVSVTISPLHLALPMVELTAEFALGTKGGVAGIAGLGQVGGVPVQEFGGQGRFYPLGNFDGGLVIGAEALWLHASDSVDDITVKAAGIAVGPFVGGKKVWDFGLTIDGGLGAEWMVGQGKASSGTLSASSTHQEVLPLLNLNLGWSF